MAKGHGTARCHANANLQPWPRVCPFCEMAEDTLFPSSSFAWQGWTMARIQSWVLYDSSACGAEAVLRMLCKTETILHLSFVSDHCLLERSCAPTVWRCGSYASNAAVEAIF